MNPTATNIAICEALGLDPKTIRRDGVRITLDGNLGPVVEVAFNHTLLPPGFIEGLKSYRLVPIEDDDPPPPPDPFVRTNH